MAFGKIDRTKPFEHSAHRGTFLKAGRCDLQGGYTLYRPRNLTDEQFASDVAEIFCWYYANIVPELNGWQLSACRQVILTD